MTFFIFVYKNFEGIEISKSTRMAAPLIDLRVNRVHQIAQWYATFYAIGTKWTYKAIAVAMGGSNVVY